MPVCKEYTEQSIHVNKNSTESMLLDLLFFIYKYYEPETNVRRLDTINCTDSSTTTTMVLCHKHSDNCQSNLS